jgi:hypothetical protein
VSTVHTASVLFFSSFFFLFENSVWREKLKSEEPTVVKRRMDNGDVGAEKLPEILN